MLSGSFVNTV